MKRFKIALGVSFFGGWFNFISMVSLIYGLTGSRVAVGLSFVIKFLPKILFSFISGYFLDNLEKKNLLMIGEISTALALSCLILAMNKYQSIMIVFFCYFLINAATALFDITRISIIPNLAKSKDEYSDAVSDISIINYSTMLIATAISGYFLNAYGVQFLITINIITAVTSAIIISTINISTNVSASAFEKKKRFTLRGFTHELSDGFHEVYKNNLLKKTIFIFSLRQLVYGIAQVAFPLMLLENLALKSNISEPDLWLGLAYTAGGVGGVIAGLFFKKIQKKTESKKIDRLVNIIIYPLNAFALCCMFLSGSLIMFLITVFFHDIINTFSDNYLDLNIVKFSSIQSIGKTTSFYITLGRLGYLVGTILFTFVFSKFNFSIMGISLGVLLLCISFLNSSNIKGSVEIEH